MTRIYESYCGFMHSEGDNVGAAHHLSELAKKYPYRAEIWLNWAANLKALKFTIAPAKILKRGLQFAPNDENLWIALEQALFEMCNFEAAEKICSLKGLDSKFSNNEQLLNDSLSLSKLRLIHCAYEDVIGQIGRTSEKEQLWPAWQDLLLEP